MKLPRSFATRKKEEEREKKRERKRHLYGGISRFHCELKPIADRNADRDRRLIKWFMRLLEGIFPSRSVHVADARRKSFIARVDTASDLRNFYSRKSNIHPPRLAKICSCSSATWRDVSLDPIFADRYKSTDCLCHSGLPPRFELEL